MIIDIILPIIRGMVLLKNLEKKARIEVPITMITYPIIDPLAKS